jgi:hypothetical protein
VIDDPCKDIKISLQVLDVSSEPAAFRQRPVSYVALTLIVDNRVLYHSPDYRATKKAGRIKLRSDAPQSHCQGRNPLGLCFLRRFRLARTVEGDRLATEPLEGGLANFFSFADVESRGMGFRRDSN